MLKRVLAALCLLLTVALPARADFTYRFDTPGVFDSTADGLQGLHLSRDAGDVFPVGISWDAAGQFAWESGLDCTMDYSYPGVSPTPPDLVLAYSNITHADNLRLRADTAQMALGPRIGHPVMPFQLQITAGIGNTPLGGIFISTEKHQMGLYMEDRTAGELRNTISLQNLYFLQTDTQDSGIGDFWLYNGNTSSPVFSVSNANAFTLNAPQEGFYGATPAAQPTVTGSWSDGSAAKSLLDALVKLGLVADGTTP